MTLTTGMTRCCGSEPTIRVDPATGLVWAECNTCHSRPDFAVPTEDAAGLLWEYSRRDAKRSEFQEEVADACRRMGEDSRRHGGDLSHLGVI